MRRSRVAGSFCSCRYGAVPASAGKGLADESSVLADFDPHLGGAVAPGAALVAVLESEPIKPIACHLIVLPYLDDSLYRAGALAVNDEI